MFVFEALLLGFVVHMNPLSISLQQFQETWRDRIVRKCDTTLPSYKDILSSSVVRMCFLSLRLEILTTPFFRTLNPCNATSV